LADFRHSGRAGGDAPLSSHRGIHLRFRRGFDRDHDHFRPGAGDQQIGLDPISIKNLNLQPYLDQLRDLPPTRDGALRHLDHFGLGGIVTFPSFHAASAVLYAWALWPARWMRPIVVLAFTAMLAATPINGGHYFIDIIAGTAIAVLAIVAARAAGRVIAKWQVRIADGALVPVAVRAE
jgi:hypothetical protein